MDYEFLNIGPVSAAAGSGSRLTERHRGQLGDGHRVKSMAINLIQIQKWSFGMWETSPPAAPLLLKATVYTHLE